MMPSANSVTLSAPSRFNSLSGALAGSNNAYRLEHHLNFSYSMLMPVKGLVEHGRVPIKIWSDLSTVEDEAIKQLVNTANLPFVFKHVAAMPDVHLGKGA